MPMHVYSANIPERGWDDLVREASETNIQVQSTVEMYGAGTVLRRYTGLPSWVRLNVRSQHSVAVRSDPPEHELKGSEPVMFVLSRRWVETFRSHGHRRVFAIGSPFVLYRRLYFHNPYALPVRKVVFFLSHSTLFELRTWDAELLIQTLRDIRNEYGSLTICIYFADIVNGNAKVLFDAGFDLTTAGHFYNDGFVQRFYEILSAHEVVLTNQLGSHVFYAIEAGMDVKWVDIAYTSTNIAKTESQWEAELKPKPVADRVRSLLMQREAGKRELHEVVSSELGLECLRSRPALLALILFAKGLSQARRMARRVRRRSRVAPHGAGE